MTAGDMPRRATFAAYADPERAEDEAPASAPKRVGRNLNCPGAITGWTKDGLRSIRYQCGNEVLVKGEYIYALCAECFGIEARDRERRREAAGSMLKAGKRKPWEDE